MTSSGVFRPRTKRNVRRYVVRAGMRPLRQTSSRFLSRGALEASQSRGLVSRLTGAPARLLNGAQRDCVYARAVDVTQRR
jgi:hypothetical protein